MNRYRRQKTRRGSILTWAVTAYLILFFGWLLPAHVLSHELSCFTTQRNLASPASSGADRGHDPDNCQLCRTQGQLGAWPLHGTMPIIVYVPVSCVFIDESVPTSTVREFASLRAPPSSFQIV